MAEAKMGTQYAREMIELFNEVAAENKFPEISETLKKIAADLEIVCTKIYFKTQKGNSQMEKLAGNLADLKGKMAGFADVAAAKAVLDPYFKELTDTITMVMEMKVRMT